jgi:hypothetical protein
MGFAGSKRPPCRSTKRRKNRHGLTSVSQIPAFEKNIKRFCFVFGYEDVKTLFSSN